MIGSEDIFKADILIVDDQEANISLLEKMLRGAGYVSIASTRNPHDVCKLHRQNRYLLILLDLQMPGLDGFQVMEGLKVIETGSYLPVLVITAQPGHKLRALKAGAKDFISKPFDLAEVSMRVYNMIEVRLLHLETKRLYDQIVVEQKVSLRESEERFRQLAENIPEVFWMTDPAKTQMLYVSPAYETIWGRSCASVYDAPGTWVNSIHVEDRERVTEAAVARQIVGPYDQEYRIVRPDGSIRWIRDRAFPIRNADGEIHRIAGVASDITERRHLERQMLRTQRLESIGTLAGGVAHDLNNALAPILMGLQMLRMQYPAKTRMIDTMESSALRGAEMVRQLVTFAKGVEGARLLVQPQHLLREMESIIKGTFPKNIQLRSTCAQKLRTVLGDATQLHQVLLNLCVNARDAMPNGGTLTLEAENAEIDAVYASANPEAKLGAYVLWRVTDTGTGIPVEILERIFEPFFSTKGPDKGTGFGLSTVMGIVKSHGGFVRVYSVPGQGSTFVIYLPAADSGAPAQVSPGPQAELRGDGETVLVVDDESAVREVTLSVLTALNFKVLTAADGTDALIRVAEKRSELRVVITDLHMPHLDGLNFIRVLKHMLPEAGIIVASGRFEDGDRKEFQALGISALLDKPFTQQTLVAALKSALKPHARSEAGQGA